MNGAEAEKELALAAEALKRGFFLESGTRLHRAWHAVVDTDDASANALRVNILSFGMHDYFLRVREYALSVRDDAERAEWIGCLRSCASTWLDRLEPLMKSGEIRLWKGNEPVAIETVRADWAPHLEGLALAEHAPLA